MLVLSPACRLGETRNALYWDFAHLLKNLKTMPRSINQVINTICHLQIRQKMPHNFYACFNIDMHFELGSFHVFHVFHDSIFSLNSTTFNLEMMHI